MTAPTAKRALQTIQKAIAGKGISTKEIGSRIFRLCGGLLPFCDKEGEISYGKQ